TAMLEVEGIHTYYGESHVLHGVSLRIGEGEAVAVLGRNGAGKTTAIRSIVGFTPPRGGRVGWGGRHMAGRPAPRIARPGPRVGWARHARLAGPPHRARGSRAGAPGPADLRAALRTRESPVGRPRRGVDARAGLRPLSPPSRARAPVRRHTVRRRAADARDRPGAPDQRPAP